jgi:hypothetical protein
MQPNSDKQVVSHCLVYFFCVIINSITITYTYRLAFNWYLQHYHDPSPPSQVLDNANRILGDLHKPLEKARKAEASNKTVESEIRKRNMPVGGLKDCIEAVNRVMPWVLSLKRVDFKEDATYRRFMKIMYASMYTSRNNGSYMHDYYFR